MWGPWMLFLLVGTGILLSFRLKFLQFTHLFYSLKLALNPYFKNKSKGDISHFKALMTALAATIGIGNIVGVATAVVGGGPGAVFWMWITALFGMATKYGEAVLAIKFRVVDKSGNMAGGPMYYIERGMGVKWLAVLFAVFGVVASFGIGNLSQSNAVAKGIAQSSGIAPWITGIALCLLTAAVILGGVKRIADSAGIIVPFMALLYVITGLIIIIMNIQLVPAAFKEIFSSAFTLKAGFWGLIGNTVRLGIERGVFSNEAGLGSAPIAAAAAKTDHPSRQALVSMTGTFLDTIIVCSVNGIVLTMAGLYHSADKEAAGTLTYFSFAQFLPHVGEVVVTVSVIFFAYSTILGWSYYGERCLYYLTESNRASVIYRTIFSLFIFFGAVMNLELAWSISGIFNAAMAIPNLIALVALSGLIVSITKEFFEKYYLKNPELTTDEPLGPDGKNL
jgi:AGCS family alanine or glycine:cation symporter